MKASKYNLFVIENDNYYIFNQLTGSLTQVDEQLFTTLKENKWPDVENEIPPELKDELLTSHFICENDLTEENIVLKINRELRYGNHYARITVLPTINCNFKCWYCYESHKESQMTEADAEAVIAFIKNIITHHRLEALHVDWFGGEPLLYFDEVVYKIGKAVKALCAENKIRFKHSITTNGYLISEKMADKINEIGLNAFQITLDGGPSWHNKVRFTKTDKNTFATLVSNITLLCRKIDPIDMNVRINYTPKNIDSIEEIASAFPVDVRSKIRITPQQVWQYKEDVNTLSEKIKDKLSLFLKEGYHATNTTAPSFNRGCYVENMLQYVINYDLSVYKCTARDFVSKKHSIGQIDNDGVFQPNSNYYNYFVSSAFENEKCLACTVLPSCAGMCIQKKIENSLPVCPRKNIEETLLNQIKLLINQ